MKTKKHQQNSQNSINLVSSQTIENFIKLFDSKGTVDKIIKPRKNNQEIGVTIQQEFDLFSKDNESKSSQL